jgi:RNA polymerase sigma factor (sigma-70 family)
MTRMQVENPMRYSAEHDIQDLADDDVVDQFLKGDEIDSDHAFRILVERHGPMVLGVCRQVLDHEADAEDAFQLTFLVLARKVASVRNRAILGAWLHEVAYRTAVKTRVRISRRRFLERQSVSMSPSEFVPDRQHQDAAWNELRPMLHDEVRRLPDKYRVPLVLSYLEGKTNEEVAALLGWPVGTVKGRLSRARALLQSKLVRRGVTLSAAFLLMGLGDGAVFAEVVPAELVNRTVRLVRRFKAQGVVHTHGGTSGELRPRDPFPKPRGAKFDSLRKLPKFTRLSLLLLVLLLSISTMVGLGVAVGSSGPLSYFRAGGPAPLTTGGPAAPAADLPARPAACH